MTTELEYSTIQTKNGKMFKVKKVSDNTVAIIHKGKAFIRTHHIFKEVVSVGRHASKEMK